MIRFYFNLFKPLVYLVLLVCCGSLGYYVLEKWSFLDSLYMTVITITTVGFGEVHKLNPPGKIFTILLVIAGVGFYGLAINAFIKIFLERNFRTIMEENRVREVLKKMKDHYIICGGGRMALAMAQELTYNQIPFVVIDNNPNAPVVKMEKTWVILRRDALQEETLLEAGINRSRGLASVLPTDADNLFVVLSARRLKPELRIETRISDESSRSKMLQAGANKVLSPYVIGGIQMARSFVEPEVDEFLDIMLDKSSYEFEMVVEHITPENKNRDQKIRNSDYRSRGFIIVGIKESHGRFLFAPDSDMKLRSGCEVLLIGKAREKTHEK